MSGQGSTLLPQTCRTRVAAPHPIRHPTTPYAPEFALFLSDTASLPRTPACWGRELGTQGLGRSLHSDFASSPPHVVSLLSTCESGGTVGRESFGHFRVFSFSPFSGTGADAPGLPRPPAGHQPWLFQQLGIRCAPPPPKTAHPGARHI